MGSLVLVRHAQASFFDADYDRLSELGREQARRLGDYWAHMGAEFDEVITGPRMRHRDTAAIVGERMRSASMTWPEPTNDDALDEHAVDLLLRDREALDALGGAYPDLKPLAHAYFAAEARDERQTSFQRLFEAVGRLWVQGVCVIDAAGTWPEYRDRVQTLLKRLVGGPKRGRRIALFTSVGPISCALGWVLGCADATAFEVGWRLHNASLTEIVFNRERATLDSFNGLPHLNERKLWTYR
jgi:broad specificity phosphatase PhoE